MKLEPLRVLSNPTQAKDLEEIFKRVRPEKRLAVAAVILGVSVLNILEAAGFERRNAWHYIYERTLPGLNSEIMVRIAKVLGVPIFSLFDDEVMENPMKVIQTKTRVLNVADSRKKTKRAKHEEAASNGTGHHFADGSINIRG